MRFSALLLAISCFALSANPALARPRADDGLTTSQVKRISSLISAFLQRHRAPGGSVSIGLDGRVTWSAGYGLTDVESGTPASAESVYRTASIGKPMLATAAMMLAGQGRLDLDAPVQRYCPAYPQKPWPVLVRHLLSHSSGIRAPDDGGELYNVRHFDRASDALSFFSADPLKFRPGTDFAYTTWGYVLLGCALEGASGKDLRSLMRDMIFAPAGMTRTRDDDPRAIVPGRAAGYIVEEGGLRIARWTDMSHKLAAGGWLTTAPDLVRFQNAWMDGRYVPAEIRTRMLTPYRLENGDTVDNYGIGWFTDEHRGRRFGYHGGGTPGVSGMVFMMPAQRLSIAFLFNLENIPAQDRTELAKAICDVVLGEKSPRPPAKAAD